jgi:membrane-bound serine protease (ClpP class)
MRCLKWTLLALLTVSVLGGSVVRAEEPPARDRPLVLQVRLENQGIGPVTERLLHRAIQQAEEEKAACLVVMLDTPGGLLDSTRNIVKDILGSKVPVVVYVAPSGARAASAGVFITLAAHKAAMAPGTTIGAAHPVQVGGLPTAPPAEEKKDQRDPMTDKVVNDTVAWARTLAERRGRNADWAERAVKDSISAPEYDAVKEHAVDLVAKDIDDLLKQIDGQEVELPHGKVTLRTAGAEVRTIEMWWGERALEAFASPTVAFLLLMFGFYGILFELQTPGWGVSGTLGVVCLLLGFFALAVLPVNYIGVALIFVALALFVAEVFVTSHGILTVAGLVCLVLGGAMLVESPAGFERVSWAVLIPVALGTAFVTLFLVSNIVKTHRNRAQTGGEAMTGVQAVAEHDFGPAPEGYAGTVRIWGEIWKAVSPTSVRAGQEVEIQGREGLTLLVRVASPPNGTPLEGGSLQEHIKA